MTPSETLTLGAYFFVLIILAVYGWHRYYLVYLYMSNRDKEPQQGPPLDPHFPDRKVGMVQAGWGHINQDYSLLTKIQAILLDGHFILEHGGRHRGGRFFNFNGTAGVWRRTAIDDAGGWQHDTLTEDLDLSYRAQLRGWRFVFATG